MAFKGKSFGDPRVRVRSDGTVSAAPEMDDRLRARAAKSSAYEKYKEQLHAFFDGDEPLPEKVREMLESRPGADAPAEPAPAEPAAPEPEPKPEKAARAKRRRVARANDGLSELLDGLRRANSPREVEAAVHALRAAGHPLPLDGALLSKALGHADEAVVAEALNGLLQVEELPNPRLLRTRVENVALLTSSSELLQLCEALKQRLS